MKTYLVGGAVRDLLLGVEAKDRDYVVTGATVEQMLSAGFQQVGKSFPVFLHPESKCEYALARIERKNGHGYGGFTFDFSPDITLEDDLYRRDLTINAMAMDDDGSVIDPYNGRADLENRILRHVGPAFREDPLRVLRVARFAARYAHLNFTVADETMQLMSDITADGELDYLTAERVFQEFSRVLNNGSISVFIRILKQCGALRVLFGEMDRLYGIPARQHWHPEIDTGIHMEMCLDYAVNHRYTPVEKFALFCHDFGKAETPKEILPSHHGHGPRGVHIINEFADRLKIPNDFRTAACYVASEHSFVHTALHRSCREILDFFIRISAFRFPERMEIIINCCTADIRGRLGFENLRYSHADYVRALFRCAVNVSVREVVAAGFRGAEINNELNRRRLAAMEQFSIGWKDENRDLIAAERKEDPNYVRNRRQ